ADLRIDSTAGAVTIGAANVFAADSLFIDNQSSQDFTLVGNGTTFEGLNPAVLADDFTIEDHIFHALDDSASGLVTWVANNDYVTQNSGSIQRGIDAASSGWTVHVQGSATPYAENVIIDKPLTLLGANAGIAWSGPRGTESFIDPASGVGIQITASSGTITIDGFKITADTGVDIGGVTLNVLNSIITAASPSSGTGVDVSGTSSATVSGNQIADFVVGVGGSNLGSASVTGNKI